MSRRLAALVTLAIAAGCSDTSTPVTTERNGGSAVTTGDTTGAAAPEDVGLTTTYTDPDGRFEVSFPIEPTVETEEDRGVAIVGSITSVTAETDDVVVMLAYSDAPAGVELVPYQVLPESVAQENAVRDGGVVADVHATELFGSPALEFEVEAPDGESRYFDVNVVLGGRRYELTVIQRNEDRTTFDAFVASFHLLQPPVAEGADFFAVAEATCRAHRP